MTRSSVRLFYACHNSSIKSSTKLKIYQKVVHVVSNLQSSQAHRQTFKFGRMIELIVHHVLILHETKTLSILLCSLISKIRRSHCMNAILKLQVTCPIGIGDVHLLIVVLILTVVVVLRTDYVVYTTESESTMWHFC